MKTYPRCFFAFDTSAFGVVVVAFDVVVAVAVAETVAAVALAARRRTRGSLERFSSAVPSRSRPA